MGVRRLATALLLCACVEPRPSVTALPPPGESALAVASFPLDREALWIRASLDLRGHRPAPDEPARFADLDSALDAWLVSLDFARRAADWFADRFRTRIDSYRFFDTLEAEGRLQGPAAALHRGVAEEVPARIVWLALNDRSYGDLVRGEVTFVEPALLSIWPLAPASGEHGRLPPGTVTARYTDGRPGAGVLSANALYWRFTSTVENANRGRANALARAFLCVDYLERPIDFPSDIDLTDSASILTAVRTVPACLGCHSTLDPFANHLWGFMYRVDALEEWSTYHVERELDGPRNTQRPTSFFGAPSADLDTLSGLVAADPRFVGCAVETVWSALMGRGPAPEDDADVTHHREAFVTSGLRLGALVRSVVTGPAYAGRPAGQPLRFGPSARPADERLVSPRRLADSLRVLTGHSFDFSGRKGIAADADLRRLAGGSDRGAARLPSSGLALVHRRLAEGAARHMLETLRSGGALAPLTTHLRGVDLSAPPRGEADRDPARDHTGPRPPPRRRRRRGVPGAGVGRRARRFSTPRRGVARLAHRLAG
jgi:hypothetical protein